jgi:hypothetical protein
VASGRLHAPSVLRPGKAPSRRLRGPQSRFGRFGFSGWDALVNKILSRYFSGLERLLSNPVPSQHFEQLDSLRAGRSGDRIPLGMRYSAPVQTGTGTHPASSAMDTWSFQGVKRSERDVNHPPPSSAEDKERAELYFYSTSVLAWQMNLLSTCLINTALATDY